MVICITITPLHFAFEYRNQSLERDDELRQIKKEVEQAKAFLASPESDLERIIQLELKLNHLDAKLPQNPGINPILKQTLKIAEGIPLSSFKMRKDRDWIAKRKPSDSPIHGVNLYHSGDDGLNLISFISEAKPNYEDFNKFLKDVEANPNLFIWSFDLVKESTDQWSLSINLYTLEYGDSGEPKE